MSDNNTSNKAVTKARNVAPLLRVGIARRSMVQKHLVLLLHSRQCEFVKRVAGLFDEKHECNITECTYMAELQKHCRECSDYNCSTALCGSTKVIMEHWRRCKRSSCPWCGPLSKITPTLKGLEGMMNQLFK